MKSDGRRKGEVEEEERQRNVKKPSEGRGKERRDTNVLIRRQNQAGLFWGAPVAPFPPRALMTPPLSPHFWMLYTLCALIPLSEALRIAHYCDSHVELLVEVRV